MKKVFLLLIAVAALGISCGRIDKQYSKVLSPDTRQTTTVTCETILGIPFVCFTERDIVTKKTKTVYVEVQTIVTEIRDIIVVAEKRDEVPIKAITDKIAVKYSGGGTRGSSGTGSIQEIVEEITEEITTAVGGGYILDVSTSDVVDSVISGGGGGGGGGGGSGGDGGSSTPQQAPNENNSPIIEEVNEEVADNVAGEPTEGHKAVEDITGEEWALNAEHRHTHTYTHTHWIQAEFEEREHTHTHFHRHTIRDGEIFHGSIINTQHENFH